MNRLFEEHQHQRRLLPWLLVAAIWSTSIWHIYHIGFSTEHLAYDISILILLPLAITLLLLLFKLSVIIDKKYLKFKMFPFHWKYKKIKLAEINNAAVIEYNKDRSFHGWGLGVSWGGKYKSYTVRGYKGVEISLKDGNKLFIGSAKAEEIIFLLDNLMTS
jgi:hypothetical protein